MSTPFSLRRDTAANIATRAGAVGEVVIDQTNQRVTVHDGSTLGGFAAAAVTDLPGRNAVINGNFAINQRAYASGGSLAAGAYAHDRWKAGTAGAYTFTQATPDTAITITSGTLVQPIDTPNVYATSYWLTWTGTATARVWQGSASGSFVAGSPVKVGGVTVNAILVTGLSVGTVTNLEFGTGTLGLVQFEAALPNAGPTRFERRHGETAVCQRYYEVGNFVVIGNAYASGAYLGQTIPYKTTKRSSSTIVLSGITYASASGATADNSNIDSFRVYISSTAVSPNVQAMGIWTASSEI